MEGLVYATYQASFEAKASEGSRTGDGNRRYVVIVGGRRVGGTSRWPAPDTQLRPTAPGPQMTLTEEEIADVSLGTFFVLTGKTPGARPASNMPEAAEAAEAAAAEAAEAAAAEVAAAEAAAVERLRRLRRLRLGCCLSDGACRVC